MKKVLVLSSFLLCSLFLTACANKKEEVDLLDEEMFGLEEVLVYPEGVVEETINEVEGLFAEIEDYYPTEGEMIPVDETVEIVLE